MTKSFDTFDTECVTCQVRNRLGLLPNHDQGARLGHTEDATTTETNTKVLQAITGVGYYQTTRQVAEKVGLGLYRTKKALQALTDAQLADRAVCADAVRWNAKEVY